MVVCWQDAAADGDGTPLRVRGYFHGWEDYALFVLFVFFTCVSFAFRFWVSVSSRRVTTNHSLAFYL